MNESAPIPH